MKLAGHLDRFDSGGIAGWILDRDEPTKRITLEIHHGSTLVGECLANEHRVDLEKAGLGDGQCAFNFRIGLPVTDEQESFRISVRGSDYYFPPRIGRLIRGNTAKSVYQKAAEKIAKEEGRWRRFRKCILHIGTEKTGSTSIQRFLGLNLHNFAAAGIFIPELNGRRADPLILKYDWLAALSMAEDQYDDDLRRRLQISEPSELDSARERVFLELTRATRMSPPRCDVMLLSDEHCHSRLISLEEVMNLKDLLDHFADSYEIIVYLRPQHELAISQYGMFVANGLIDGEVLPPLPPPPWYTRTVYTSRSYFDYEQLLGRWRSTFGTVALKPRLYQRHKLVDGDVVKDFASQISLSSESLTFPKRQNSNISARAQQFLLSLNQALSRIEHQGKERLRERMRNAAQHSFSGSPPLPTRQEVIDFCSQFEESNERVRAEWFPVEQKLFDIDLTDYPERPADHTMTADELMGTFVATMLADQDLNFSLAPDQLRALATGDSLIGVTRSEQ